MSKNQETREVPIAWEALEDAFENNAPEVHSYLQLASGEVTRIVDGVADPNMHQRILNDGGYLRIDPVSSREQYRWMERFIDSVEDADLQGRLGVAIDGKGAFRRFKDVLMQFPVERERWFSFRSERLRSNMETWLSAHGIVPVERPKWPVPSVDDVKEHVAPVDGKVSRAAIADAQRERLRGLVEALPARELETATAFLEFLRERRPVPRGRVRRREPGSDAAEE